MLNSEKTKKVVALAGGVGGAKLAHGLALALPAQDLAIIVNTGDDFEHFNLKICPDLDTVCYTLAGMANPATGWGRADETWQVLESLEKLGGPVWFRIGDRDLATHLERTRRLREGQPLSQVTLDFCQAWGIKTRIMPMSDDEIQTVVETDEGEMAFQEYFVRRKCEPQVKGFRFAGVEKARPAPGILDLVREADLVVICPSNPWVSIDPILAVPGIRPALQARPVVAVSPIIGGQALKGPAAKMFSELGIQPSASAVADHYGSQQQGGILSGFVIDDVDGSQVEPILAMSMHVLVTDTIMQTQQDRRRLAETVLAYEGSG